MATYTGGSLDKLRKQDLIQIVLSQQIKLEDKDNTVLSLKSKLEDKDKTVLEVRNFHSSMQSWL